ETRDDISALCRLARGWESPQGPVPSVAAVCIYPEHVRQAKDELSDTEILVATVAGGFPGGETPTRIKVEEVQEAVAYGADEIDMVMNYSLFLKGDFRAVHDDIVQVKSACRDLDLKVILETGKLGDPASIRHAAEIAIEAGADFIKTSTGKTDPAATEEAALVMLQVIKEYYHDTGIFIGFKPAGGIREPRFAFHYLSLVYHVLGGQWLKPSLFRIGASQLLGSTRDELLSLSR
ncbi:MAG TPA: deoxyribose-phosphate aldolase, partial [Bacteroidales bacterium]|nr:deoxyribose-phosphate aldolase [Bacteroidales bacterium]